MQSSEQAKRQMAEKIWLLYFNRYLMEAGVIDEREENKIRLHILSENQKR